MLPRLRWEARQSKVHVRRVRPAVQLDLEAAPDIGHALSFCVNFIFIVRCGTPKNIIYKARQLLFGLQIGEEGGAKCGCSLGPMVVRFESRDKVKLGHQPCPIPCFYVNHHIPRSSGCHIGRVGRVISQPDCAAYTLSHSKIRNENFGRKDRGIRLNRFSAAARNRRKQKFQTN